MIVNFFSCPIGGHVKDLCSDISGGNDVIVFRVVIRENFSYPCSKKFQSGAKCFTVSRSSGDSDWRTQIVALVVQKGLSTEFGILSTFRLIVPVGRSPNGVAFGFLWKRAWRLGFQIQSRSGWI